ncbi:MAG: tRNA lysidine(34) synthetase TilS [Candidatus Faecousia sp.]|nr:tRNA lysidine(34) synthetase TilS [Candidatus Faecousia sp.]
MLNKLRAFLKEQALLSPGDKVIAAVSGGADSVAMLFALYLLRDELGITLEAAHFNHHLRGAESDRDEAFVTDFCGRYCIPLHLGSGRIVSGKKGLEAAARDARYAFLRSLPGKVATAHTADDNAETVLMRLIRGTGLKGLGAIAPVSGNVIRPMLTVTRDDVEAFLEEYALPHVEDSSNAEDDFLRNRIRHGILPLMRAENPRIGENLSAMALLLRQDEACLQAMIPEEQMPDVSRLKAMEPALRRRTLERFLKAQGVREPEQIHILQAEQLLYHWSPSASMQFPGGVTIGRQYDRLVRLECAPELPETRLSVPGETCIGGKRFVSEYATDLEERPDSVLVCPVGVLIVRSRRSGDTMRLPGGTRSLKKMYIDRKIPASQRAAVPVLADDRGVLAVFGIGTDIRFHPDSLPAVRVTLIEE